MRTSGRQLGTGVATIATATAIAGMAGYALLTVIGRLLPPADFGIFVVYWGVLFGIGGTLATVEQDTSRRVASRDERTAPTTGTVTIAAAVVAAAAASMVLVEPVSRRLYGDVELLLAALGVVAVAGFAMQFAVKGLLIGSGSVGAYSRLVVAEAAARLVLLVALWLMVGINLHTAAIAVAAGSLAWLFWFYQARSVLATVARPRGQLGSALLRATSLMVGAGLMACVIVAYPAMVTALTGEEPGPAGGAAFAALTISRIPLLLIAPIQAMTVPAIVRWQAETIAGGRSRLRQLLIGGTVAAIAVGLVGAAVAWPLGPWAVRFVYGANYDVPAGVVAALALSAVLLGWMCLISAALVAVAAVRRMVMLWLAASVATAAWLLASPLPLVEAMTVGALIGPVIGIAVGFPMLWTRSLSGAPATSHAPHRNSSVSPP